MAAKKYSKVSCANETSSVNFYRTKNEAGPIGENILSDNFWVLSKDSDLNILCHKIFSWHWYYDFVDFVTWFLNGLY